MQYLKTYIDKIIKRGNSKLALSIEKTAKEVGDRYLKNFSFTDHEIGLLFGNIQSGKTGQMFGITCYAADHGFPIFILLTTDNVVLQQQTLNRVKSDLDGFCICGENDGKTFVNNRLINPTIIVLKKNARVLRQWSNILNSTGFVIGNPLFIIDDEADTASLNTFVNQSKKSSINKYLDDIKNKASCSLYLQVTGTPQALFLQTLASGWHPYFTYYFEPGETYLGGDFFFSSSGKPECIAFIDLLKEPIKDVVIRHLAVSAQTLSSGDKVSNCLIHPSAYTATHEEYAKKINNVLNWCINNPSNFESVLNYQYNKFKPVNAKKITFKETLSKANSLLQGGIKVIVMNGKNDVEINEYFNGCNFIIGGNSLGRGVTFPKLHTIYYTRTSKNPNADSMWQHSRMFGYDRDPGLMMIYIDKQLYKLFSDINSTNNSIISQIEKGLENIKICYPKGINPTRKNVLDKNHITVITGGTNYFPYQPDNISIDDITNILSNFTEKADYYQVSLKIMKEILSHIVSGSDFKTAAFRSIIDTILAENPIEQGILIVRRNRNVTQGTGALLSPKDWQIGILFPNKTVLTMYQVTGTKGWGGKPLWVPNIKLPKNILYYDVSERKN